MNKDEFLSGLRKALALELPESEIESNIRFYDEYINTNSRNKGNEEQVIDELGDPRLIAKTIIETYQLSHGPIYQNINKSNNTNYEYTDYEENDNYQRDEKGGFNFHVGTSSIKWYHKLILFLVLAIIFALIIFVGGVILRLFFSIGLPILVIYFGYTLIKNNMRR